MKGPRGRLKHFVRRHWECPLCHRREWTSGKVVNRLCDCSAKSDPPRQIWMTLIEERSPSPQERAESVSDRSTKEQNAETPAPSPPSPLPQGERGEG